MMRLLLDTHVYLWWLADDPKLAQAGRNHADPFDRLLVAQAMMEPLRLLTHDVRLAPHSSLVLLT